MTRSSFRLAALAGLVTFSAACTKGGSPGGAGDASASSAVPVTSATASASGGGADSASCALVSQAEAEAILGEKLKPLTTAINGMCEYHLASEKHSFPYVGVKLYPGESKSVFESETKNAAKMIGAPLKPVTGFGEESFALGDMQIDVLQHGKAVSVTHWGAIDRAKLEALVRKAVSKL